MILQRLSVQNLKGIASRSIDFKPGLNLLAGPNESGKSTLREALYAALFYPFSSTKPEIRLLSPWNGAGPPRVELDFSLGGEALRVEKSFGKRKAGAQLFRAGKLVAQDAKVQEQLEAALTATGELDWVHLLWGHQGEVRVDMKAPRSLQERLEAAAGSAVSPELEGLESRLLAEYARFWTPKSGKPKKAIQDLRDQELAAETDVQKIELELEQADERAAAVVSLQNAVEQGEGSLKQLQLELEATRGRLEAWSTYRGARERAEHQRSRLKLLEQWLERVSTEKRQLEALLPEAQLQRARQKELQLRLALPPSREAIDRTRNELRYLELLGQRALRQELAALKAPSQAELGLLRTESRAKEKLDAASEMRATFTAVTSLNVKITADGAELPGGALRAGVEQSFTAAEGFQLELPGVARLEVSHAPVAGRAEVEKALAARLQRLGVANLEEAEERCARATVVQLRIGSSSDPEPDLAQLRGRLAPASLEILDGEQRDDLAEAFPTRIEALETDWKTAQQTFQTDQAEFQRLLRDNVPGKVDRLTESLAQLRAEGPPGFEAADDYAAVRLELGAELKELDLRLQPPAGVEVTPELVARLESELESERVARQDLQGRLNREIGALAEQGELYFRKQQAEERLGRVRHEVARADREAFTAKLLWDSLAEARKELETTYTTPLQGLVGERLQQLTGGRYRGVSLDRSWGISEVLPTDTEGAAVTTLSFGTQEQLAFLSRLCLAELLGAGGQRHLVVFDDNLVHTDQARMEVACGWLEAAAATAQVVVFTCHPERYSACKLVPVSLL